jgi:hypothetical protein
MVERRIAAFHRVVEWNAQPHAALTASASTYLRQATAR